VIPFEIKLDGDGCWPDLQAKRWIPGKITGGAVLANGTTEGRPTVTLRIETADGKIVLAETTLRLLDAAVRAMRARYPDDGG